MITLPDISVYSKDHEPLKCKLDLIEVEQLQEQDMHLSKIKKGESQHHYDKTLFWMNMALYT